MAALDPRITQIKLDDLDHIYLVKQKITALLKEKLMGVPSAIYPMLEGSILTGGAIASVWHGEEPNDLDMYLRNEDTSIAFNAFMKANEGLHEYVKDVNPKYMITQVDGKLITANAVTFKNKLQVITIVTRDQRVNFDYLHCMPYLDWKHEQLVMSRAQIEAIKHKKLVLNPKGKFVEHRRKKFLERGWKDGFITGSC